AGARAGARGAGAGAAGAGAGAGTASGEARMAARDAATLNKIEKSAGKHLVIVESPAKAKTLEKFLGRDFFVLASYGHVKDLPKSGLGIDLEKDFEPEYVPIEGKGKVLSHLKLAAQKAGDVYLAPDPDREGEAIAWHLATSLKPDRKKIRRLTFNEITERAVKQALDHPRDLDMNLVNAQQARRVLDRLVGYQVSPLLWQVVRYGLSAGRVQSVALRLVCEREIEVRAFVPEEYWTVEAELETESGERFKASLFRIGDKKLEDRELKAEGECLRLIEEMRRAQPVVADIKETDRQSKPRPPFITSTLQQDAYGRLGFGSKRTMQVAQRLYEGIALGAEGPVGLITYMRTDSTRLAAEAIAELREFITRNYGAEYVPKTPPVYGKRAGAQDAHEAIRPTGAGRAPDSLRKYLTDEQQKLYQLIWSRAVASQMNPARYKATSVDIGVGRLGLKATGSVLVFAGHLKAYGESEEERSSRLPQLEVGQKLRLVDLHPEQHFTQPPPRYTEATLVKALEELGIGRPSTYATIISTITGRDYVTRDGGRLVPSELGMAVSKLLVRMFPDIFQVDFTRRMEEELDRVETGEDEWHTVIHEFYEPFKADLDRAQAEKKELRKSLEEKTDIVCPECTEAGRGTNYLVRRFGRNGPFYACPRYPECKYTRPVDESEIPEDLNESCPECGEGRLQARSGRYGRFVACSRYPACKFTRPLGLGVRCPKDGGQGELVERRSRRGKTFYSCNRYPECDYATWDRPVPRPCPQCAFPFLSEKTSKKKGTYQKCSQCNYEEISDVAGEAQSA
ncbi:MAG: type I DNA topoisomerase, partial [Candidatus Eiseniibacteriota bacterium]